MRQILALCALCLGTNEFALAAQSGDVLVLRDGRILEGHALERVADGVVVHFKHGDVHVAADLCEEVLIENDVLEPASEEERSEMAKGRVRFEGKWMSTARRDQIIEKRLEQRRDEIQDLLEHSHWGQRQFEESRYFAWEHVLPRHVFSRYSSLMDAYFKQFAKDWKIKAPKKNDKLLVCFYKDMEEMAQVGGAGGGVLGYFRWVEPLELNFFYERLDPGFTEEVMFHEANHYLQSLIDENFTYPHFPGESLAEYYGASRYDEESERVETGMVLESRLVEVQADVLRDEMMSLERLVSTEDLYEHYNWGWSLVHFLMSDDKTAAVFKKFMVGLAKDRKVKRISVGIGGIRTCEAPAVWDYFKECFDLESLEDVRALERAWQEYVHGQLEFVSAIGKSRAAERALTEGRRLRAKRLFEESLAAGGDRNPLILHRAAKFHLSQKNRARAIELWRQAVALAPIEAEFYAWLGGAMRDSKGDEEEGLRLQLLALEIDPSNAKAKLDIDLAELAAEGEDGKGEGEGRPPKPPKPPKGPKGQ